MIHLKMNLLMSRLVLVPMLLLLPLIGACSLVDNSPYEETFDSQGRWGSGQSTEVEGQVNDGWYELQVLNKRGVFYASAGENFGDGIYEVEAIQLEGPINSGYGMLFHLEEPTDTFYVFEISSDGYVWIGYCSELCDNEARALVGRGWFRSNTIVEGVNGRNHLQVIVDSPRMTFLVNGIEVGRTSDARLVEGDIAVMVETLGEGNVKVAFDNVKYSPH